MSTILLSNNIKNAIADDKHIDASEMHVILSQRDRLGPGGVESLGSRVDHLEYARLQILLGRITAPHGGLTASPEAIQQLTTFLQGTKPQHPALMKGIAYGAAFGFLCLGIGVIPGAVLGYIIASCDD